MADPGTVAALGGALDRLRRKVGGIEVALADLAEAVAALEDAPDRQPPTSWLAEHADDEARALLADLVGWLAAVFLRFDGVTVPACWLWHPAAVEELIWLRQAHLDAYAGRHASITRVADWHDRLRPGVVRRLAAALSRCDPTEHGPDGHLRPTDPATSQTLPATEPDEQTITKAITAR